MRVHVWFGAGRLLIPVKGEETVAWLCGEVSRRLARRLGAGANTAVEGLRLAGSDAGPCLDSALTLRDAVADGGAFVAVMAGDPEPTPVAQEPQTATAASAHPEATAVCVQCGQRFCVAEEAENERLGRFPADPAQICRFHAQPPVKFLWTVHYTCCNSGGDRDVPCRGGFHRATHHTDYPYAAFVPYAAQTMSFVFEPQKKKTVQWNPLTSCASMQRG